MNPARTTYMRLLLFLMVTIVAHADAILTLGERSRGSVPQSESWSSVVENSNSSLDGYSWTSAGMFRQPVFKLTLADTKNGSVHFRSSVVAFAQPRLKPNLAHIKNDAKHKDKAGKDHDYEHQVMPEPPMAATLAVGLTLLFFKLRRSK